MEMQSKDPGDFVHVHGSFLGVREVQILFLSPGNNL